MFFSELFFLRTAIEFYLFGNCKRIDGLGRNYADGAKLFILIFDWKSSK